jgi:hypothetical protein
MIFEYKYKKTDSEHEFKINITAGFVLALLTGIPIFITAMSNAIG